MSRKTVGSTICLLLILCLLASEVNAESLDELQIFEDAITDRVVEDKSIEINQKAIEEESQIPEKPRFFKNESEDNTIGMDSLTLIWYLTTFTALLGFFVVMACTEKTCGHNRNLKPPESDRTCPPTPCPSYKNFAPPSYDSVMKKFKTPKVFIVPVHDNNSVFNQSSSETSPVSSTSIDIEKGEEITVR